MRSAVILQNFYSFRDEKFFFFSAAGYDKISQRYGIYDENELITIVETNESGIGYIDKLPFGKYYIKSIFLRNRWYLFIKLIMLILAKR